MPIDIPDKLYFRIGEVARITDLKPYVLRYWQSEFPTVCPVKSKSNQRVYQRKDIESILLIKRLLYEEKYTIEGAREKIRELKGAGEYKQEVEKTVLPDPVDVLRSIRERLVDLENRLN